MASFSSSRVKNLHDGATWRKVKEELHKYLGKEQPRAAAWKKLSYKVKGKCFGEIASEVRELAVKAADEEDVQERLAVEGERKRKDVWRKMPYG